MNRGPHVHTYARLKCCFTSTETVGVLETGAQDVHLDFHTVPELWYECEKIDVKLKDPVTCRSECMSEFGGLRKHKNDPACTKFIGLESVQFGHVTTRRTEEGQKRTSGGLGI